MASNSENFPRATKYKCICAKFEEIPSTSKDDIGGQTCGYGGASGAGGPFRENSSHMQTSVPRRTLNSI